MSDTFNKIDCGGFTYLCCGIKNYYSSERNIIGRKHVVVVDTWIKFNEECVEGIGQGANSSSPQAVSVLQMVCGASGISF